jgi:hypothetical protein
LISYKRFYVTSRYVISDIFSNEIYRLFAGTTEWLRYIKKYDIPGYVTKEVFCSKHGNRSSYKVTVSVITHTGGEVFTQNTHFQLRLGIA